MFDKSRAWQRYKGPPARIVRVHLGHVPELEQHPDEERTAARIALALAIAFHLLLLVIHLPDWMRAPDWTPPERPVYSIQQVRFQPPPPAQQRQLPRRREPRRVIPIPDPTPDEPEPMPVEEIELPEVQLADLDLLLGLPEAPPGPGGTGSGPLQVGGDVTAPIKIFAPLPPYTEEARQARLQGVVILEAVIDALGNVDNVKVLKGLDKGLSESAVLTAEQWRFKPATRQGVPVPVYYNLTIRFSLQ